VIHPQELPRHEGLSLPLDRQTDDGSGRDPGAGLVFRLSRAARTMCDLDMAMRVENNGRPRQVPIMVRKKRTGPGGSGETSGESSGASGQGSSQRPERTQQPGAGRGWVPQQGGRGGGQHQGRGGHYQGRGGPGPHHPGGLPEYHQREYQGRGGEYQGQYQGRGGARSRGGISQPYYGGHRGGSVGRNVPPGPSRTVPELHQAPYVQYQAPVISPSPSGPGSSSQPMAEVSSGQVQQQFEQLAIHGQSSMSQEVQVAPASSKSVRFPLRPGKGTYGDRCIVKANHFFAELPDKDLHQYDVTITPEVTSRGVNRAVMGELVTLYRQSHLGGRLPAYDGRKSLYTAGPLPFTSMTFEITLQDEEDSVGGGQGGQRRERVFRVVIKFAARADLHHLAMFLAGRQADAPQEALQVLDIVLRELPTARYSPVGRSFYSPNLGRRQQLGEGLESWRGFYQSIRPTQMGLSLNIDMSSTAFIEPLPVIDFVAQLLNRDISVRPLSDSDRVKIKKSLKRCEG